MFFADRCILKNRPMVERLLAELHLPPTTKTESDPHYKCKNVEPNSQANDRFATHVQSQSRNEWGDRAAWGL